MRPSQPPREPPRPRFHFKPEPAAPRTNWTWPSVLAAGLLSGGLVALVSGGVLTVVGWFLDAEGPARYLRAVGTVVLVVSLPLLAAGAHCLDLAEKRARPAVGARPAAGREEGER